MWCLFISLDQRYGYFVWQESSLIWKGEGDRIPDFCSPVIWLDLGERIFFLDLFSPFVPGS
jgi:hypothetical protein